MMKEYDSMVEVKGSYLVGDSAEREKDHSDSDRHFCENLGIELFTPKEFFLGEDGESWVISSIQSGT
jgi:hypothetical protein